eukprot:scaffold68903_cov35-Attheya_sp.AAC.1
MGCSKQCSTKLYVPHLPSTEGSEGGIVPAMHQINFKWPNTKDAKEEANKQAKFLKDVKDLSDILSDGVDKSSHISSPSEMYDPIITHQQIFMKLLDRKSLQDINSQRLANVSNTFQEAFSSKTSTLKKKKSQFLTQMKVDKNPREYKNYYKTSIQNTINKFRSSFKTEIDGKGDYSPLDMKEFRLPGPTSKEVDGVHPSSSKLLLIAANKIAWIRKTKKAVFYHDRLVL